MALGRLVADHLANNPPRRRSFCAAVDCDSADANYEYVLKGIGVAWLPWSMVRADCRAARLAAAGDGSHGCAFRRAAVPPEAASGLRGRAFWHDITQP